MSRTLSLALVVGLTVSTPTSSHAILTELVVGGGIILQLAGVMSEAIPQITALSGAVSALVTGGQQITGTIRKLIDLVIPGHAKKDKPAKPARPGKPAAKPAKPGKPAGTDGPPPLDEILADEPETTGGAVGDTGAASALMDVPELRKALAGSGPSRDLAGGLTELAKAYLRQQGLLAALEVANPTQKDALQAGLRTLSERYELQVDGLAADLVAAGKAGDQKAIEGFVVEGKRLSEKARAGLDPLFEKLAGRGATFDALHGDEGTASEPLPPLVKAALESLRPTTPGAPRTGGKLRPLLRTGTR